jgi:hypothetical protein
MLGPASAQGYYVYGPDHEYHLLSRNQPYMVLRPHCNPQWNPGCNMLPAPGYPLQPLIPIGGDGSQPLPSMEQDRESIIQQGEAHCRRFPQDTQVCHSPHR